MTLTIYFKWTRGGYVLMIKIYIASFEHDWDRHCTVWDWFTGSQAAIRGLIDNQRLCEKRNTLVRQPRSLAVCLWCLRVCGCECEPNGFVRLFVYSVQFVCVRNVLAMTACCLRVGSERGVCPYVRVNMRDCGVMWCDGSVGTDSWVLWASPPASWSGQPSPPDPVQEPACGWLTPPSGAPPQTSPGRWDGTHRRTEHRGDWCLCVTHIFTNAQRSHGCRGSRRKDVNAHRRLCWFFRHTICHLKRRICFKKTISGICFEENIYNYVNLSRNLSPPLSTLVPPSSKDTLHTQT